MQQMGIWYYEISVPEDKKKYSKTKPIQNEESAEISQWWNNRKETGWAWKVNINDIVKENGNGSVSVNPDIKTQIAKVSLNIRNQQY